MRVSLVTPVFNQAEYLGETIESVLYQDYIDLEYYVIDDGSTDGSLAIAERYAEKYPGRLTVLTQANAGQAATLNRGWSLCTGEVLGYLSSDDRLLPGAVSSLVRELVGRQDAVVVYCDFELIDAAGGVIRAVRTEDYDRRRLQVDLVCQPGPGALFRRQIFDVLGGWRVDLRQVPDYEFWLRASNLGEFFRCPEISAQYRVHEESASFRIMSDDRAKEIVGVVDNFAGSEYWGRTWNLAQSKARMLAAKNCFQSGNLLKGSSLVASAISKNPNALLDYAFYRVVASGLLRRLFYRIRHLLQPRPE
jgi:glycosyltransferase involved in cell wall biosynthesis